MIEILTAMCILTVNTEIGSSPIVTQVNVLNSSGETWTVDAYSSLKAGGYNVKINSSIISVNSNDCLLEE